MDSANDMDNRVQESGKELPRANSALGLQPWKLRSHGKPAQKAYKEDSNNNDDSNNDESDGDDEQPRKLRSRGKAQKARMGDSNTNSEQPGKLRSLGKAQKAYKEDSDNNDNSDNDESDGDNKQPRKLRSRGKGQKAYKEDSENDESADFRSPTKKRRDMLDLETVLRRGPSLAELEATIRPPFSPTPEESLLPLLLETPTLTLLGMKYQREYNIAICDECQMGVMFNSLVSHALEGKPFNMHYKSTTLGWRQQKGLKSHYRSRPKKQSSRSGNMIELTDKEIRSAVLDELQKRWSFTAKPYTDEDSKVKTSEGWMPGKHPPYTLPHQNQDGPIAGLAVYKKGLACVLDQCKTEPFPYCTLSSGSMDNHQSRQHPFLFCSVKKKDRTKFVDVQTICGIKPLTSFFIVSSKLLHNNGGETSQTASTMPPRSLTDLVYDEERYLFGNSGVSQAAVGSVDSDLFHPVFDLLGMVRLWSSYSVDDVQPLRSFSNSRRYILKEYRNVHKAVIATFLDICSHAKGANSALSMLVMKGST